MFPPLIISDSKFQVHSGTGPLGRMPAEKVFLKNTHFCVGDHWDKKHQIPPAKQLPDGK